MGRAHDRDEGVTVEAARRGSIFSLLQRAFGDAPMEAVWSERATVAAWLRTEAELARSQAAVGDLDAARAEAVAAACAVGSIDLPRLWEATANVGYPILPLIRQVHELLPEDARGVMHYGATTQDIMDTGLALQLAEAHGRLGTFIEALGDRLADLAERHATTAMAGRTHGQQAVPTTFGAKLATYLRQAQRLRADLDASRRASCVLSLHGAAGTSAALGPNAPAVRAEMARRLGLEAPSGPWHVARDGIATFGGLCGRIAGVCARFAREVADLARTEIGEVAEAAGHHRGASSTMPQKENPIDSETVLGMAVTVTGLVGPLHRAMEAGHERSTGEWQVEWHVVPQVAVLTAGALSIAARIVEGLRVDAARMERNLGLEQGRILAEAYLFRLAPTLGREAAHDLVYEAASRSRHAGIPLHDAVLAAMRDARVEGVAVGELVAAEEVGAAREEAMAAVEAWRRLRSAG
jgi:3-carboxy-cis,cis-muconate cycloisomerase